MGNFISNNWINCNKNKGAAPVILTTDKTELIILQEGSQEQITVTLNINWSLLQSPDWVFSNTKLNRIVITVPENASYETRTGIIILTGDIGGKDTRITIPISQAGNELESISKAQQYELKVFPNPFSDKLSIEITDGSIPTNINIYSISGLCRPFQANFSSKEINLSNLIPGTYVLKLICNNNTYIKTIIKK